MTPYSPSAIRPAVAALAANGCAVYPSGRFLMDAVIDGKPKTVKVDAILYNQKQGINILFEGKHSIEKYLDKAELDQIEKWVVKNIDVPVFPDDKASFRMQILLLNTEFIHEHGPLNESDFEKAEAIADAITKAHTFDDGNIVPLPGDIVEGAYYQGKVPFKKGVIETPYLWQSQEKRSVCAHPYSAPFTTESKEKKEGYCLKTSGGPFFSIDSGDMELVGPQENIFWTWGHEGPCADGGIRFKVMVNRWRISQRANY